MNKHAFQAAVKFFGSQGAMAKALGIEPMTVSQWKVRGLPPARAAEIERLTSGEITRAELLPEIFGEVV
jgi:DNA-binding transcriptional regulator YdaS (Cro superfamily)